MGPTIERKISYSLYRNENLQKERENAWQQIKKDAAENEAKIHAHQQGKMSIFFTRLFCTKCLCIYHKIDTSS